MNLPSLLPRRELFGFSFSIIIFSALIRGAGAAEAGSSEVMIAKTTIHEPVSVKQDEGSFTLSNGIVTAKIDKRNGDLESLLYKGIDTMGHDQGRAGYWEQDPSAAAKINGLTQAITIDPEKNDGERAEVSVKAVTKGDPKAGLTPGSPGGAPGGMVNCDLEIRYSLGRGESGVYVYAIFSHPEAYGPLNVPESRYITKLSQTFDWISVDADRNMLACAPKDWGTGVVVHAKEQRILSQGFYKNSVEHKYSYTAVQYKIPAFGWSSTRERVGIWFINPTIEYLSGGASKQELVCHLGETENPDPIILNYWRGTHFGGGAPCYVSEGEKWSKVVGPTFIYVNSLGNAKTPAPKDLETLNATAGNPVLPPAWKENATALWQDALSQAKAEKDKWPYDWVQGVDYPHKSERGTVVGQLILKDSQAATTKLARLTIGLAFPDGPAPTAGVETAATGEGAGTSPGSSREGGRGTAPRNFGGGRGGARPVDWVHDAKHYQFWNDGKEDGHFTITQVRPGNYTLHAFADGVLGEFAQTNITVRAGETLDLGKIEWKPLRYGKQLWEIGYPDRTGGKFFKGDGENYWLWGWGLRYPLLFPTDLTYTIGKSDYRKDWFFQQTPRAESKAWMNPHAKDPANQRFGWVKEGAQGASGNGGPWSIFGHGRATTWTIKFNLEKASQGTAFFRLALAGADTNDLEVAVNGASIGTIHPTSTNALRYNTNKSVWQERLLKFSGKQLKVGENQLQLTVPAGDLTTGVVYDYLRLELDDQG